MRLLFDIKLNTILSKNEISLVEKQLKYGTNQYLIIEK